jgi:histone H3
MNAVMEIKKYQKSTGMLLRKAPFARLVKEIVQDNNDGGDLNRYAAYSTNMRFTKEAFEVLQESAEHMLVQYFEELQLFAAHAKRVSFPC